MSEHRSADPATGELVARLSEDVTRLVKDELRLAQLEVTGKAKKAGTGVGMVGAAGLLALYGVGVLLACAVLALALVLDAWLAALVVGLAVLLVAGIVGLVGKSRVSDAAPPTPDRAVANAKQDIDAVKHARD